MRRRDSRPRYNELAKVPIADRRNVVLSEHPKGGYTLAQQLSVKEGNRNMSVFMKGAFHIDDIDGIYNLRDALNIALADYERKESVKEEGEEDW